MILISGLCAGFCVLWFLCTQLASAYNCSEPVLSIVPTVQTQPIQQMQFPFEIPGTTLIAEQIVSYDGLFTEGDSVYDVTNVAALLLYNYGDYGITDAEILLQAGKVEFRFTADTLPAGERLLVPEQNRKEYGPKEFTFCTGWQQVDKSGWQKTDIISLQYPDMGEVVVTNLTDGKLNGIYLLYKTYYPEADFYVGGQTCTYYIEKLDAGESIRIYPHNYALGYSRFARIMIDEPYL